MISMIVALVGVGIALIVISFFMTDKIDQLESLYEELSISTMQDTYQMKKQIQVLEEELLTDSLQVAHVSDHQEQPLLIQQVYELHEKGISIKDIAKQTDLDHYAVKAIINNSK